VCEIVAPIPRRFAADFVLGELLGTDAAEAAWNYCAPVVDYDALRKEVLTVFADRAAEVQGMVVKLQKTQRAAEQALDRYFLGWGSWRLSHLVVSPHRRDICFICALVVGGGKEVCAAPPLTHWRECRYAKVCGAA